MLERKHKEIELSEELLLKERKDSYEREYITKIENTDLLFCFSEKHLLTTDNEKAREIYLGYIASRLGLISRNSFEVNKIDFYIGNFCSKDSLIQDERFNTINCKRIITRIQVILTYFFLKDEMDTFFDKDSEEYLFSWPKNDILNYLQIFNDSMNPNFCFNYHDIADFESYLYKNGIEEIIVDFLIECYNEDKDTRPILILVNALKWMNINIVLQNKSAEFVYFILTEKMDPNPLKYYFTNLLDRALPNKLTKLPGQLFPIKNNLIEYMLGKSILPSYFDFISENNNYDEAIFLYNKLSRDYKTLYIDTDFVDDICSLLIELIEYASCGKNFNINITADLIKNKKPDERLKVVLIIRDKFKKFVNETNREILTKKIYGYCNLLFRLSHRIINNAFDPFHFIENVMIAECSLEAISKCIKFLKSDNSSHLLKLFLSVLDISKEYSTFLSVCYYIECFNEVISISKDLNLQKSYNEIFINLMKRVFAIRLPEEDRIFVALFTLFQSPNFPSFIYFNSKDLFIEAAVNLINTRQLPFIECASQLINSIKKMKNHDEEMSTIYDEITKLILSLQPVDDGNMFVVAHLLSLLTKKIIESNEHLQEVIKQFLPLDQEALSTSKHYVQVIIQCYGFQSYEQIQKHFSFKPDFNTLLMITQLPTNKIDKENEEEIRNAVSFADIIINYLESSVKDIKELKLVSTVANSSINYIMPIYEYLENTSCLTFNNIILGLIVEFQINKEALSTFLKYFENSENERIVELSWDIFRELKSIFVEKRCRLDIDDFDNIALQVLEFQHFMFMKDPDMAHLVFTEKVSKNSEFTSYAYFLHSQINRPFNEKPFKEFISLLKKRYRIPIRSLNHF